MNGVIVYFPLGAGGNLVKNIISLDSRFEFSKTNKSRYEWMVDYYSQSMTSEQWLPREWSIRAEFHEKYYVNERIVKYNPAHLLVYDLHGGQYEVEGVLAGNKLHSIDPTKPDSKWTLQDCEHVFLLPNNQHLMMEIYNSKNPTINHLEHEGDLDYRRKEVATINTTMTSRLRGLQNKLAQGHVYSYTADSLYTDTGYTTITDLASKLGLDISHDHIKHIHSIWLQSTRELYYNYFKRELPL
jgi:hypothetical protein